MPSETPGHLGDLAVVVALDVVEHDGRPLVVGDAGQRRGDGAAALGVDRDPLRVRLGPGGRLPALVLELGVGLDRPPLAGPLLVHRRVDADPVEPRLDAAAAEPGEVAVGGEERLLDGVGRLVAVGDHAHDEREHRVLVEDDEVVECIEVARSGALDEDEVAALDGVVGDRRRAKVLHGLGVPPDGDAGGREARRV